MTISIYVIVAFCIVFGFSLVGNIFCVYMIYLHITGKLDVGEYNDEFEFYESSKDSTTNKDKKFKDLISKE